MQVVDRNGRLKVEITSTVDDISIGVTTISGGTNGRVLYDNAGVVGEIAGTVSEYIAGDGSLQTFPTSFPANKMVTVGRNATGSTLYKGTIVYILGSTGNRPNFVRAQANTEATSAGTFGVIENDILNNSDGNCVTIGTIDNLDTRSTATHPFTTDTLADGDTIYLSPTTAGYVTNVKPYAPSHLVYVGKVVRTSPTNGTIVYRIQNGYELDELHDVAAQTPNNNEVLSFESATTLWKPKSLTTLLGFTPVPTSRTLTINGTTQDLSADRTFTISTGITIGTTAITSGTNGRFLFDDGGVVSETNGVFWDKVNGRFGVGTSNPSQTFQVYRNTSGGYLASFNSGATLLTNASLTVRIENANLPSLQGLNPGAGAFNTFALNPLGGNILIGTTTDAGYKLDVNGTARVSGNTTVGGNLLVNNTTDFGYRMDVNGNVRLSGNQNTLTGSVLIGTTYSFAASAVLKIDSTTQGFLPPRMTTTQKNAIASPATGLMVFDLTLGLISVYNGTIWISL